MSLNQWTAFKDIATPLGGVIAALIAASSYRLNAKKRRAEFICQLHKSSFEDDTYKEVRLSLDVEDDVAIADFVAEESEEFTDFLNFFELVAYLQLRRNLSLDDVDALLGYYINLLRKYPALRDYISNHEKGFEQLERLLAKVEKRKTRRS